MTWLAFWHLPIRPVPDARNFAEHMKRDGVQVKILTGDNELVARHVCEQVGLEDPAWYRATNSTRRAIPRSDTGRRDRRFSRACLPMQKLASFIALKHRGHVVGYMGDGINDAPSLHAADVGISVSSAVDVARDAADIILLEAGAAHSAQRNYRRPQRLRERYEISADGNQLEFRQYVQHGGRFAVSSVSADAADANPAE